MEGAEPVAGRVPASVEATAATALGLAVAALTLSGQRITAASAADTARFMASAAPAALALGLGLQLLHRFANGEELAGYLRALRRPTWWLDWARLWLACWVTSFAYFWLKVYVPRLHAVRFDDALASLDRTLHLGVSPAQVAGAWLGVPLASGLLDAWYALWLASLVWCLAFFAASSEARVRGGVVLSCLLLWALGSWIYVLVPALGPALARPDAFSELAVRMPRAAAAQAALLHNHRLVLAGAAPDAFQHTLGVAALPSLHVGFHVLFTLWARAAAPLLFWPFVGATLLTFVGSLATGWHYAVDGYLGAALAAACYLAARRLVRAGAPGGAGPAPAA